MSNSVSFTDGINNPMNQSLGSFGKKNMVDGSKEFLMSNTIVAKIAFLLLVIIGFVLCLRVSTKLIMWYNKPNPNPYLVTCRRSGELSKRIPGDPGVQNSIPILRSKNERTGVEFTWSVWLYVDKPHSADPSDGTAARYYHIFHKGSLLSGRGILTNKNMDATPGLYIKAIKDTSGVLTNSLVVVVNTFSGEVSGKEVEKETVIDNIPMRKWIHVAIRIEQKNLDTYINGILTKRRVLPSLPRQNYGDVYIGQKGSDKDDFGFSGELSSLRYFNSALNPIEINNIVKVGPNMCTDDSMSQYPPYFSQRWYL
tara:strand:- start:1581 stop:2513 length:933 start_codon:yes stop_codon:yes gene_type:complete